MKSSMFLAATGALLAMAAPAALHKRAMHTEWEVVVVTQTITANYGAGGVFLEGGPTAAPEAPKKSVSHGSKKKQAKSSKKASETVVVVQPEPEAQPAPVAEPSNGGNYGSQPAPAPKPEKKVEPKPEPAPAPKPKPSAKPAPEPKQPSSGGKADVSGAYKAVMLKQHNVHRANHSVPALQWSDELAGWAQELAKGCTFRHDRDMATYQIGQNIASGGTTDGIGGMKNHYGAVAVTERWYNGEMELWPSYDAPDVSNDIFEEVGHFSQILWKGTQKVGCASVECSVSTGLLTTPPMPGVFTVCNYFPSGNYAGQYNKNVLPPLGKAMVTV